jgi:hypothetical protein
MQQLTSEEMVARLGEQRLRNFQTLKRPTKAMFRNNRRDRQFYSTLISTLSEKFNGKPLNLRFVGKSMVQLGFFSRYSAN